MSLKRFPRRTLRGDRTVYRIHRAARDPWWFSSDGSGRFDPVGTGLGACYLAERPLGAWVEVFSKRMLLAEGEVTERALLSVELRRDVRLADLTSRRALGFGVTASLRANELYDQSQAFAVEAAQAGFHGVRHLVRHDPAKKLYGIALFAPAGAPDPADPSWPRHGDGPIPDALVAEPRHHATELFVARSLARAELSEHGVARDAEIGQHMRRDAVLDGQKPEQHDNRLCQVAVGTTGWAATITRFLPARLAR